MSVQKGVSPTTTTLFSFKQNLPNPSKILAQSIPFVREKKQIIDVSLLLDHYKWQGSLPNAIRDINLNIKNDKSRVFRHRAASVSAATAVNKCLNSPTSSTSSLVMYTNQLQQPQTPSELRKSSLASLEATLRTASEQHHQTSPSRPMSSSVETRDKAAAAAASTGIKQKPNEKTKTASPNKISRRTSNYSENKQYTVKYIGEIENTIGILSRKFPIELISSTTHSNNSQSQYIEGYEQTARTDLNSSKQSMQMMSLRKRRPHTQEMMMMMMMPLAWDADASENLTIEFSKKNSFVQTTELEKDKDSSSVLNLTAIADNRKESQRISKQQSKQSRFSFSTDNRFHLKNIVRPNTAMSSTTNSHSRNKNKAAESTEEGWVVVRQIDDQFFSMDSVEEPRSYSFVEGKKSLGLFNQTKKIEPQQLQQQQQLRTSHRTPASTSASQRNKSLAYCGGSQQKPNKLFEKMFHDSSFQSAVTMFEDTRKEASAAKFDKMQELSQANTPKISNHNISESFKNNNPQLFSIQFQNYGLKKKSDSSSTSTQKPFQVSNLNSNNNIHNF